LGSLAAGLIPLLGLASQGSGGVPILTGAGATMPSPLYNRWISSYTESHKVRATYRSVGSGEGIRSLIEREVDFGGSDVILSEGELAAAPASIVQIPTCVAAVAITYHLPGNVELRLTPELLDLLLGGSIVSWSDHRLAAVNPGIDFPELEVTVVHRSDSSGTTYILTDFLSRQSARWQRTVGQGKLVRWPTGIGVEGNRQVVDFVKRIPGAISYVSHIYAERNRLTTAFVKTERGAWVRPSVDSVSQSTPDPEQGGLLRQISVANESGYPIYGLSFLLVYREQAYQQRSREHALALVEFLRWTIHEGQAQNRELLYGSLPEWAVSEAEAAIGSITYDGRPLVEGKLSCR
jgi:phosphate transport system substrate-binding protein